MPNYLQENDWKTELKKKENKDVKKTGMSDALRAYEKAAPSGGEPAKKALASLISAAKDAKKDYPKNSTLGSYLDEIVKAATQEQGKLGGNGGGSDGKDEDLAELAKRITAAKNIADPSRGYNFVCALGKTSGIQVTNKSLGPNDVQMAKEQRGKGVNGPMHRGTVYGDSGKVVFDFGEEKPPGGSAKALSRALKTHCQLTYKVLVRGGGVSIDEDQDQETNFESPFETATGMTDHKAQGRQPVPDTIEYVSEEDWGKLLNKLKQLEPAKRQGMLEGMFGLAKRDAENLKTDKSLSLEVKKQRAKVIQDTIAEAKKQAAVQQPPQPPPPSPQTSNVQQRRNEIHGLMAKNVDFVTKSAFVKGSAQNMAGRKELGVGGHFDQVRQALGPCEDGWNPTNFKNLRDACDNCDKETGRLISLGQEGLPQDSAQNALARTDLNLDSSFKKCAKIMAACENSPTPKHLETLRKACEVYLKKFAKDRPKAKGNTGPAMDRSADIVRDWKDRVFGMQNQSALQEQSKATMQARTQLRLAEISIEYKAIGDPAHWTREDEEVASELQAAYLFEEGTIAGGANFGAVPLGGDSGVNVSYWIKRKNPIRKDDSDSTESLFIFKPSDSESDVVSGLPAGSGAAREVIAKDLSDFLSGSGLKLDVCPTNLVSVDGPKLPGSEGKNGAPRLGSMQRLGADVKGGIADNLRKDNGLAQRIDKKEFDHLVVYDMIIGNMDRHGGNILLSGDLSTNPKLVPIDHGSSMPGVDSIKLNRQRLLSPQNILASTELPQGDAPLSDDAKNALRAIKPDEMAKSLRESQARLAKRHTEVGQPGMGIDDEQIKVMTRSTQFMQAAADKFTVRELFEAKARYIDEIMADPEPKWGQLVDDILNKLQQRKKDLAETKKLIDTDASSGQFDIKALHALGWCMGMSPDSAKQWAIDNPGLIYKILAGKIENPRLKEEAEARRKALGGAPKVEADPLKLSYKDQIVKLKELTQKSADTDDLQDLNALEREFKQLGGEKVLGEVLGFCSADREQMEALIEDMERQKDPQDRAQMEEAVWRGKIERMRMWKRFVDAGGIPLFAQLGGAQAPSAADAYNELLSLQAQKIATGDLDKISSTEVAKRQAEEIKKIAQTTQSDINKIRVQKARQTRQGLLDGLLSDQQKDPTKAQAEIKKLSVEVERLLGSEEMTLKLHRQDVVKLKQEISKAPEKIGNTIVNEVDKLEKLQDDQIVDNQGLIDRRSALGFEIELAQLGDQSLAGKSKKRLDEAVQAIAGLNGKPYHNALVGRQNDLDGRLKAFVLGGAFDNDMSSLEKACAFAGRLEALRQKLNSAPRHPNATQTTLKIAEIDQLFNDLATQDFNGTVSKISEGIMAGEHYLR